MKGTRKEAEAGRAYNKSAKHKAAQSAGMKKADERKKKDSRDESQGMKKAMAKRKR